ncbi:MAG: MliC family protein [Rhodobacterales bacterium]|nr:MliC family protein [Rhodobacterales bacterium]
MRSSSFERGSARRSIAGFAAGAMITGAVAIAGTQASSSSSLSLALELGPQDRVMSVRYSCTDGTEFDVQYVNARSNNLAILRLNGEDLIFVNVISGSGARYVSGAREWWTKGTEGSLRNEISGAEAVACSDMSGS